MELIYMNEFFVERGIISDFEIDLAYGKDENDFEIKTPEKDELKQGYYWYIKDTEYGGVIDEIEFQNSVAEGIFRGRTWSGILNSFNGIQLASSDTPYLNQEGEGNNIYLNVKGTPKAILTQILVNDLGLNVEIMEDSYDESEISTTVLCMQPLYSMLIELFHQFNLKLVFEFDGVIKIGVMGTNDFSDGQYFDTSQVQLTATSSDKLPNHLIGVYKTDEQTYVKHIYFDENGVVQPYYQIDTDAVLHTDRPVDDYEYLRATGTKQVEGLEEIVEVVEGGSTIETFDYVKELQGVDDDHPYGTTGNTKFNRGIPYDWNERCYDKYYQEVIDTSVTPPKSEYKNFVMEYDYEPFDARTLSDYEWNNTYTDYFKRSAEPDESGNYTYTQLTYADSRRGTPSYAVLTSKPRDWNDKYGDYYYRFVQDGVYHYSNVTAVQNYKYIPQGTKKPTDWSDNKSSYFRYWWLNKYKWKVELQRYIMGKWQTVNNEPPLNFKDFKNKRTSNKGIFEVYDDLSKVKYTKSFYVEVKNEQGKKVKKIQKKNTNLASELGGQNITKTKTVKISDSQRFKVHKKTRYHHEQMFTSLNDYCSATGKKLKDIKFEKNTYYRQETTTKIPDFFTDVYKYGDQSGFYERSEGEWLAPVKQIYYKQTDNIKPTFNPFNTYIKVQDHYSNLCEAMLSKYYEIQSASNKIEPRIDSEEIDFDIGDIVGGTHPITEEQINNKIIKKIVKGNTFALEVDYEIG